MEPNSAISDLGAHSLAELLILLFQVVVLFLYLLIGNFAINLSPFRDQTSMVQCYHMARFCRLRQQRQRRRLHRRLKLPEGSPGAAPRGAIRRRRSVQQRCRHPLPCRRSRQCRFRASGDTLSCRWRYPFVQVQIQMVARRLAGGRGISRSRRSSGVKAPTIILDAPWICR